jgi:hypothetical protein
VEWDVNVNKTKFAFLFLAAISFSFPVFASGDVGSSFSIILIGFCVLIFLLGILPLEKQQIKWLAILSGINAMANILLVSNTLDWVFAFLEPVVFTLIASAALRFTAGKGVNKTK